jgi:CheY-like chemotaxis protein
MVLLVEDDAMLRTSVARGLRRIGGIEILEAGTVEEAREIALAMKPQLLVADLDLPDGTGAELVSQLARVGFRVPVVFISAYVNEFSGRLPRRKDIVVREKPISLSDLRELVLQRLEPDQGSETPFHVTDYIQLACMSQRSAILSLRRDGRLAGEIVVKNGDVYAARDGKGAGEEAFRRLLFKTRLTVTVGALAEASLVPRNIEGSSQHIMMEAARLHDEAAVVDVDDDVFLDEDSEPLVGNPERPIRRDDRNSRFSGRFRIDEPQIETPLGVFHKPEEPFARHVPSRKVLERKFPSQSELPAARVSGSVPPAPARFDAILDVAVELFLKKRYEEARQAFLRAAEMNPGDARIERNLERLRRLGYG